MWETIRRNKDQSAIKTWNQQEKAGWASVNSQGQVSVASWVSRTGKVIESANKGRQKIKTVFGAAEKEEAVKSVKTLSQD